MKKGSLYRHVFFATWRYKLNLFFNVNINGKHMEIAQFFVRKLLAGVWEMLREDSGLTSFHSFRSLHDCIK